MSFKILYVSATQSEADALIKLSGAHNDSGEFIFGEKTVSVLVTGVGSAATAWSMQKWIYGNDRPDLIINGGIAGSFKDEIVRTEVVMPFRDCFADSGIEDGERMLTLFEAGLSDADHFPFRSGYIYATNEYSERFSSLARKVSAITVNTATGSELTRQKLVDKYNPDIETMEGATFSYICAREKIPFLALRAISNKVELRNKNNWDIRGALNSLSEKLDELILRI